MTFKLKEMKEKTVLKLLILFILIYPKTNYATVSDTLINDTICLDVKTVEHLSKSTELYYLCKSDQKDNEEEIKLLRQVIEEKQTQENLHQGVLSQARNEVTKLRRQRTLLSVGLGGALVSIIVLVF
jgi:hypothetical protein